MFRQLRFGYFVTVLLIAGSVSLFSCIKNNSNVAYGPQLSISISGAKCTGSNLSFNSNAPLRSNYVWNFGDGSTTTIGSPSHTYTTAGTYSVSLIIDYDTTSIVHYTTVRLPIIKDPLYTHLVSGSKNWRHITYIDTLHGGTGTFYKPDTNFSVNFIDPLTISFGRDTLSYDVPNSTDTVLKYNTFSMYSHNRPKQYYLSFNRIMNVYNIEIDSNIVNGTVIWSDNYYNP